jgi:hypothetical protein
LTVILFFSEIKGAGGPVIGQIPDLAEEAVVNWVSFRPDPVRIPAFPLGENGSRPKQDHAHSDYSSHLDQASADSVAMHHCSPYPLPDAEPVAERRR